MTFKNLAFWLFPPYEAYLANSSVTESVKEEGEDDETRLDSLRAKVLESLPENGSSQLEDMAKGVVESETNRREGLENKASSFVSTVGIVVSINALAPAFLANNWKIPFWGALIVTVLYILATFYFLLAVYYALKVRQAEGLMSLSADSFMKVVQEDKWEAKERIAFMIAQSWWNQNILLKKSNNLAVAEKMFPRGLLLVGLAIFVSIAARLWMS